MVNPAPAAALVVVNHTETLLWPLYAVSRRASLKETVSAENDIPSVAVTSRATASAAGGRPAVGWAPVAALAVFGLPFAAFSVLILYHFYIKGSFFLDSGLFAFLMSQTDPRLPMPPVLGGGSYLAVHFAPIFVVLSLIRRLLPVADAQFFAGFIGFCHALPGLAVFWLLHSEFGLRTRIGVAVAAIVSIAFSFNGLALAIVRYPHFEILIADAVMLFIVALIRQRLVLATLFFALALASREDAGFHLFGVLLLVIVLNRWYGTSWRAQKTEIAFAAIAFSYSLTVLGLQHAMAPGQSPFAGIYLGDPAFGKLSPAIIGVRLLGYVGYRTYIVLPAIIAVLWAVRVRNPYIALGYVAFLPWTILHLTANSDIAGTLSAYYAYPFLIASFWPLVGIVLVRRPGATRKPVTAPVLAFVAMIAGSFAALPQQANPGHIDLPRAFFSPPSLARQATTDRAIEELSRSKALLAPVLVDGSVLALAPGGYTPGETVQDGQDGHPNTVIYFVDGYEAAAARALAAAAGLDRHYQVPGTSIRLATDLAIAGSSPLAAYLAPAEASE